MSHSLTLTAQVRKIVRKGTDSHSGDFIVFHAYSNERRDEIWFIVNVKGRMARVLIENLEEGDRITAFGKMSAMADVDAGGVYVHASIVEIHGVEANEAL